MDSALNLIYYIIFKKSTQLTAFIWQRLRLRQQPSLLRKLGPLLFWMKAQRIYLVWKEDVNESYSSYSNQLSDSESTLSSMREWPETSAVIDSRDSDQMELKIEEMQQHITQLQAQLSLIIVKIAADERNSFFHDDDASVTPSTSISSAETLQPHIPLASQNFQPPPPPPPLPPKSFCAWPNKIAKVVKVGTGNQSYADKRDTKACSIVEELAMKPPKLRHVERSPGGRPVRSITQFTPTNNSDILTAVLKKRFEALHSP